MQEHVASGREKGHRSKAENKWTGETVELKALANSLPTVVLNIGNVSLSAP